MSPLEFMQRLAALSLHSLDFRTFNPIAPGRIFPINDLAPSGTTFFARRQALARCTYRRLRLSADGSRQDVADGSIAHSVNSSLMAVAVPAAGRLGGAGSFWVSPPPINQPAPSKTPVSQSHPCRCSPAHPPSLPLAHAGCGFQSGARDGSTGLAHHVLDVFKIDVDQARDVDDDADAADGVFEHVILGGFAVSLPLLN